MIQFLNSENWNKYIELDLYKMQIFALDEFELKY